MSYDQVLNHSYDFVSSIIQLIPLGLPGTCEITVFASGKWAEEKYIQLSASPDLFRQLALFVIQDCVVTDQDSGYITHGFQHAIDYVTDPSNGFPTNLDMPANTTYFTVVVQASNDMFRIYDRDPGNYDAQVSVTLVQGLEIAMRDLPSDGYLKAELEVRQRFLWDSHLVQENGLKTHHAWWEPRSPFTLPMMNLTSGERCNSTRQSSRTANCSELDYGNPGSVER